ncbi:MAG: efflux transporter outer membrane subunit [Pseudomonadota bacterium]
MRLTGIALATSVLLAGCAIPSSRPELSPLPDTSLGLSATGAAQTPAIADDWWRSFGDTQLDRLVTDAQAGNPTLEAALARVRQASAILASSRADNGPNAAFDASAQYSRLSGQYEIPPPFAGTTRFLGQAQAGLNWNLDLFGRQKAVIAGARASTRAALLDATAARLALAGSVVQTYIELARAEQLAGIAQRTIVTRQGSLRLVQVRIRNKLASELDSQAAETLLAQAQQALVRATAQRALAANALAALAGRGTDYPATIAPATLKLDTALPLPSSIPADLLARRADVTAALARIDAASEGRLAARRAFYPDINLSALVGLQAIGIGNFFSADAGTAGAGAAIHLPIFDNGRLKAGLAGATAGVDLAIADYNEKVVSAVRETADALTRIQSFATDRARQTEVVRGFAETGRLNTIRVSSGLESRLGLVDNDVRLLDAQQADANLAADAASQRVALVLALGGGFDPKDVK